MQTDDADWSVRRSCDAVPLTRRFDWAALSINGPIDLPRSYPHQHYEVNYPTHSLGLHAPLGQPSD